MAEHSTKLPAVTVLGLGPMGSALAEAYLRRSHPTTVWNRTPNKAAPLVALGASHTDTIQDAITAGSVIISCVADYDAMYDILRPVEASLRGRTLVNLSSGTPRQAREAAEWAAQHGIDYLDGAIMVPVPAVGRPDAVFLYSGPTELYDTHRATLAVMGGATNHLGTDPGLAVLYNTALLGIMYATVNGFYHATALVETAGVSATEFGRLANGWFLGSMLTEMLDHQTSTLDAGDFTGTVDSMEMNLTAIEHLAHTSREQGINPELPDTLANLTKRTITAGHTGQSYLSMIHFHRNPNHA